MSLTTINAGELLKKQYRFKMKSYRNIFSPLVILQLIAILFSLNGVATSGGGGVNVNYYSADMVIVFTMLWAFINAIMLTTKAYREDDFIFVTNRVSNNLANIAFLFTVSIIGGMTAILSGFLLKVIMYFGFKFTSTIGIGIAASPIEYMYGVIATILFIFLFSLLGYFVGVLVQLYKPLAVLLPVAVLGLLFGLGAREQYILIWIGDFYFQESVFWIFLIKMAITVGPLGVASVVMSNRQEVRK